MTENRFFPEIRGNFGFGCMRMPVVEGEVDPAPFCAMIDAFLEAGFNYFDTAHGYLGGKSETAIRDCLAARYPRDRFVLTDKLTANYFQKTEDIEPFFRSQLAACGVDYFDFYLMHAQDRKIYEKFQRLHAYETVCGLKAQGLLRHFGISFHDKAEVLEQILTEHPEIEVVQIQFNYVDYEDASVESRKVYEVCEKHGKPVIVMEPVKGGNLVNLPPEADAILRGLGGGSNASYAIRFAASFPNMAVVLSGMGDMAQVTDNTGYMRDFQPLNDAEKAALEQVCGIFRAQNRIPCTGCRYCVLENECPMGIRIPDMFAALNTYETFHDWNASYYYGSALTSGGHGKASDCVRCGQCEAVCPQHLPIRELLETVAETFEKKN